MSTLAPHRRTEARVRRIASLVLSIASVVLATANIVLFFDRPSTFVTEGTFGLDAVSAFFVDALWYTPLPALAAVLLVGTLPPLPPAAPSVDALPKRFPMTVGIIACAVVVVATGLPLILSVVYLMSFLIPVAFLSQ